MFKRVNSKKELLLVSIFFTSIFYLLAHSYRCFSPMFSGDSLLMIHQNDSAWQIALGRYMQPFLLLFRGGIASPLLISGLSIIWISYAAYFLVDFLEIKRVFSVVSIVAVMVCNSTVLVANSTFLPYADFYALALFLAVFGVWLIKKEGVVFSILGSLSLCISLGIYQSYICVAIALVMILFLFKVVEFSSFKKFYLHACKYLIAFSAAAILYYGLWKIFQKVFNIWTANTYNGLASVGDYSGTSVFNVLAVTYKNVFNYFMNPETFVTMSFRGVPLSVVWVYIIRLCNIFVLGLIVIGLVKRNRENKSVLWQRLLQGLIVLVFPLGINFVCIISKGMEHTLMIYAFGLLYVLAVKLFDGQGEHREFKKLWMFNLPWIVVLVAVMIVSWSNIVYSNQVYLKKDLQDRAMGSLMTRIVYEIESMDGYVPGETPVAFYGTFENSGCVEQTEAFKDILPYGMGKTSLTYAGTDYAYLTYILNVNMNLTRVGDNNEMIRQMPVYPTHGSVAFVDGILVVKISE